MKPRVGVNGPYHIFVKKRLYKTCINRAHKEEVLAKLAKDKSLKPGDIMVQFTIDIPDGIELRQEDF